MANRPEGLSTTRPHKPHLSLDLSVPSTSSNPTPLGSPRGGLPPASSRLAAVDPPTQGISFPSTLPSRPFQEEIFSNLEEIRELSSQLASAHNRLENISSGNWSLPVSDLQGASDDKIADHKGRKATTEAYTAMKKDFDERQHGVDEVIQKLNDLSAAVKSFNSLPPISILPSPSSKHRERSASQPSVPAEKNIQITNQLNQ